MTRIVGLTGSIAMGKSTTAALIRRAGIPLFDADAAVHRLMAKGGRAVSAILSDFPGVESAEGGIDRMKLGAVVFADKAALRRLEAIIHPMVQQDRARFLAASRRRRIPLAVLDVPLLYETGGDAGCDAVLLVSAPAYLQRQRVMARPGMTEAKFASILAKQMPDREKRRRTPYVIRSGIGKRQALIDLNRHLRGLNERPKRRRHLPRRRT